MQFLNSEKDTIEVIEKIRKSLIENKWLLAYLFVMCGIIIIYASFLKDDDDRYIQLMYNSLFFISISVSFILMSGWIRKLALIVFSILTIPSSIIETGWFLIDRSLLVSYQFNVIFATNPAEASGLLSQIQVWQWLLLACYVSVALFLFIRALKENGARKKIIVSIIGALLAISLIFVKGFRYNVPCLSLYSSYRGYQIALKRAENFILNRQDISSQVCYELPEDTTTIVIVIGESLTRNHCSLYGYGRLTNPRLSSRDDLIVYQDVKSPDFMTLIVLQQILTFSTKEHPEARWESPTLPELLNAAGWYTYWYEPYEGWFPAHTPLPTSYSQIAQLCTKYHLCDDKEKYDAAYLNYLDTIFQDSTICRKVIFLHLIGNHFPYEKRYPESFKFFKEDDICSPYKERLNSKQKATINAYDDAVRYNDWLIDSLLNQMCLLSGNCAMLYFPDHGEEVYDFDFYAGRSFNHITNSLYEIPCVYWQNASFAKSHPLHLNPLAPYNIENMIHTLLDLCAVSYCQKDTCRSLFRRQPAK